MIEKRNFNSWESDETRCENQVKNVFRSIGRVKREIIGSLTRHTTGAHMGAAFVLLPILHVIFSKFFLLC